MQSAGLFLLAVFALEAASFAAESPDKDPAAVLELGGAVAWGVPGGGSSGGPTVAVEVTPIEDWLELEGGVTGLFAKGSSEWDTDLVFKKPWTLSREAEFMAGIGRGVGAHAPKPRDEQCNCGRGSAGLHVLAGKEAPLRMVFRAGLRLQLRPRA